MTASLITHGENIESKEFMELNYISEGLMELNYKSEGLM